MSRASVTERQAAKVARQFLYRRNRWEWMVERMAENETTLERYLINSHLERDLLPGGYAVERLKDGTIRIARLPADGGYEQS